MRANKKRLKVAISGLSGLEFREITDPEGECATLLTVFLPSEEIARRVADELSTRVVADSDWHAQRRPLHQLPRPNSRPPPHGHYQPHVTLR